VLSSFEAYSGYKIIVALMVVCSPKGTADSHPPDTERQTNMSKTSITLTPTVNFINRSQLAPVDLSSAFEDKDILCLYHDTAPIDGSTDTLSPIAPYGAYTKAGGIVTNANVEDLLSQAHLALAQLAGSLRNISPITYAAQEMDRDFNTVYRIHYYRSCTIVTWADPVYGVTFLQENDDEDYEIFSPERVLCDVYVAEPESNHAKLSDFSLIEQDIRSHVEVLQSRGAKQVSFGGITLEEDAA